MKLKDLLGILGKDIILSSLQEIKDACEVIIEVQSMETMDKSTLCTAYNYGPMFESGFPSETSRDNLVKRGYLARIVVKGSLMVACTERGANGFKLICNDGD